MPAVLEQPSPRAAEHVEHRGGPRPSRRSPAPVVQWRSAGGSACLHVSSPSVLPSPPPPGPAAYRSRPERGAAVALASNYPFLLHFRFYWSRRPWPWDRKYHTAALLCLPLCTYHPCRPSTAVMPALSTRLFVLPSGCVPQWYASPNRFVRCHVQQVEPYPARALAPCLPTLMCLACQPI